MSTTIIAPCPDCGSQLNFEPNGRYGQAAASCTQCGDDYGLAPSGVGRLGPTPGFAATPTPESKL